MPRHESEATLNHKHALYGITSCSSSVVIHRKILKTHVLCWYKDGGNTAR
ncbi:hypothetical protein HBI56_237080 [Parastagonospora nodorum]|nr:hypothetical protein HBI10_211640 [Parastagonospora nodorum]KAH4029669.1 hypothetical protein HBI13_030950 [Parastagonospora nodorum]KAH4076080.1 hypothetical protein HBH50_000340 [Parastagonospora nodorum]KAH4081891.1 hypothetical protein HBH48_194690 [Parastagonospora nodorum]KAH4092596.1 hypothetical protein HBH46_182350 [Parastagonospora nodorum]